MTFQREHDAITLAFRPSAANRRLQELLIGYALGSTMARGWWREHRILIRGPMRGPRAGMTSYRIDGTEVICSYRNERQRMIELHPAVGPWLASWHGLGAFDNWHAWHDRAREVGAPRIRERLERETGYESLYTRDECADAARIYPEGSMGAKALLALHRSNIWKGILAYAA